MLHQSKVGPRVMRIYLSSETYYSLNTNIRGMWIFSTKGGGMLRFWNVLVLVLVLVLNFESFFLDLLASVGLVNKNGCKGQH